MKILQDIATAVRLTGEVRKARKTGASGVQVKPQCIPFQLSALDTGDLLWRAVCSTVQSGSRSGMFSITYQRRPSMSLHLPQRLESGATVYVSGSRNSAMRWSRICTTK